MMFLFTKSKKIGSKAIRWALNEPCSHFAISFDESPKGYGIVLHSHLAGVGLTWFKHFYAQNDIVGAFAIRGEIGLELEESIYQAIVNNSYGSKYDRSAFAYFCFAALRSKLFNIPLPRSNPWQDKRAYLCTEIYSFLVKAHPEIFPPTEQDIGITSPHQIYLLMKSSDKFIEVPWIVDKSIT